MLAHALKSPTNAKRPKYFTFKTSEKILEKYAPQSKVLSPGPFIRGVEVESAVIDGPRSLYATQVGNGVAVRMAALFLLAVGRGEQLEEISGSVNGAEGRSI